MSLKTAVIYGRVSTVRQADDGISVDSQIEGGRRKAEALEADVLRVFRDDGISGRTDERPAFRDAVSYCRAHQVDYFICWSTSRFARNKLDAALYKKELKQSGCRVVYVSVDIDNETDSGWMMESILEIFDEHYSRQVSADTLRSMMKNARDGFWNGGRVPFGYQAERDGKRARLVPDETEAGTVREIFDLYLRGLGCKAICVHLNDAGRLNRGRKWAKNTLSWVLKNMTYAGFVVFNRTYGAAGKGKERPRDEWIITPSHRGIISEEIFMRVQNLFGERAPTEGGGSARSLQVFTGILRCSCGAAMTTESATGNGGRYTYYNCNAAQRGTGCTHRRIRTDDFDGWMIEEIMDRVMTTERLLEFVRELHELTGEWVKDRARRREAIAADLRHTDTRLRNLFEILELHGKDAPNLGDLTIRMRELKRQREELEGKLIELEEEVYAPIRIDEVEIANAAHLLRDVVLTSRDPVKLRTFFSGFIKAIVLDDQGIRIEYRPEMLVNRAGFDVVHSSGVWLPDPVLLRTKIIEFPLPTRFHRKRAVA